MRRIREPRPAAKVQTVESDDLTLAPISEIGIDVRAKKERAATAAAKAAAAKAPAKAAPAKKPSPGPPVAASTKAPTKAPTTGERTAPKKATPTPAKATPRAGQSPSAQTAKKTAVAATKEVESGPPPVDTLDDLYPAADLGSMETELHPPSPLSPLGSHSGSGKATPWWIWASLGAGCLVIVLLLILILSR